ncbi:MAG: diaminopropionate ammonia-lyase [Rhizomicrobium sp.]
MASNPMPPAVAALGMAAAREVLGLLACCPVYKPTPLWHLDALAAELGLGGVFFKDESYRLGLNSFKALGGVYAIAEILRGRAERETGRTISPRDLLSDDVRGIASEMTFACASDGNHGRSVAAGARLFGARCVVFLHEGVSAARRDWIAQLGADIRIVPGTYDHSVEEARRESLHRGWTLVPDTAEQSDAEIPHLIMRGYTVLIDEAIAQLPRPPTHVFVQAGVGGLAAAVTAYCGNRFGHDAPRIVVVEPERANCLLESCRSGGLLEIPQTEPTIYAMLECLRPSQPAWDILDTGCDDFLDVPDALAVPAMRRLAFPTAPDPAIVSGESGATGLAGLLAVCAREVWFDALGLSRAATVLLIGTEGATDPEQYERLVGKAPT